MVYTVSERFRRRANQNIAQNYERELDDERPEYPDEHDDCDGDRWVQFLADEPDNDPPGDDPRKEPIDHGARSTEIVLCHGCSEYDGPHVVHRRREFSRIDYLLDGYVPPDNDID